jgi:queuine tRNA-ribosyltransferase
MVNAAAEQLSDTPSCSTAVASSALPTASELRQKINSMGAELKQARLADDAAAAAAALERLLAYKKQYVEVTGAEYRSKSSKRGRQEAAASAAASSESPVEPKPPKRAKVRLDLSRYQPAADPMELPPPASSFPAWEPRGFFRFEVVHRSRKPGSRARVGRIFTPHGVIDTPAFVPVGTNGALKGVDEQQGRAAGTQLMFCNTYHLLVHPGPDVIRQAGGLHSFAGHEGPIITDSGGFQVFSLGEATQDDGPEMKRRKVKEGNPASLAATGERGALFRSYLDGQPIELTPESSVAAQKDFGSDIIIPLDELPPNGMSRDRLHASVRLSHRWMARSLQAHLSDPRQQAMYAVVHGGTDVELRRESAEYLSSLPFDGFAIGGSLGKDRTEMLELLRLLMPRLPEDKPNHLLGIADPDSAAAVVPFGVDTMDSCNPTRIARHGTLLCAGGSLKISQVKYKADFGPIDPTRQTIPHTRAYLHHLFKQHELLFMTLASQHNMIFMHQLMSELRQKILNDEI